MPRDPALPRPSRAVRILRGLAVSAAVLIVASLLLEVGHRAFRALRGRAYDAEEARGALLRARDAVQNFVPRIADSIPADIPARREEQCFIHPFYAFDLSGGVQQIDDDLARARSHAPGEEFEVLLLGGSVAEVFANVGGSRYLAHYLESDSRLEGRTVSFFKYGRGGFKQPQQLNLAAYLLSLGFEPDAIVLIDGFNEVALGNNNADLGVSPVYPSFPHWMHLALAGTMDRAMLDEIAAVRRAQSAIETGCDFALRWRLYQSSVLGSLATGWIGRRRTACEAAFERYTLRLVDQAKSPTLRGPERAPGQLGDIAQSVRAWMECSRMLAWICRGRSIPYLHVLQPTLHDPGSKVPTAEEIEKGALHPRWKDGVLLGYPMLRQGGAQLAREGLAFLDLSLLFQDRADTIYFDGCHFGREGNEMLARRIATAILESLPDAR